MLIRDMILVAALIILVVVFYSFLMALFALAIKKFLVKKHKQNNMDIFTNATCELDMVQEALIEKKARELALIIVPGLALFILTMGGMMWLATN